MAETRNLRIGAFAAGVGIVALAAVIAMQAPAEDASYTFDGTPSSPLNLEAMDFDVQVHSRNPSTWEELESMQAQHGADCAGPPSAHENHTYEGAVFICKDHLMTAINAGGYGVIYLTPNRLLDFSGDATLDFELSTEKMSTRDWWDVLITPMSDSNPVPLLSNLSQGVDLQGPPRNTIHIGTDNGQGTPLLTVYRNGSEQQYGNVGNVPALDSGVTAPNQAATRQHFRFTISGGHMKFERLVSATAAALTYWDYAATVPFTSGTVQFGHHSYTPTKDGAGVPGTWHWDSIALNPATPFTIIKTGQRMFDDAGTIQFDAPAPAGAVLRFSAVGKPVINGVARSPIPTVNRWGVSDKREHVAGYSVQIPEGSTSATIGFVADGWYHCGFGCHLKDAYVWSLNASGPTATPTNTPTLGPPTSTPTDTPTALPTNTPTATRTPGATQTITFNDAPFSGVFSGTYGGIVWSNWYLSGPWSVHTSKSLSYPNGSTFSKTFAFVTPKTLVSLKAGGDTASTITLSCAGNPNKVQSIPANTLTTITTGWAVPCTTVTIASTNGWHTNFDDLGVQ